MANSSNQAQPPLEYIAPQFNSLVLKLAKIVLPWWLKLQTNIDQIEVHNSDILVKSYQQFQQGKIRLLLAFRHPKVDDPLALAKLFWHLLPQEAKKQNITLDTPVHVHFVYDRGIPLWAGKWAGWLFSRLGGSSILRGKLDLLGLKGARNLFVNGKFPLAIAPEGATNGHNDIISPLEPGIAQLSFWCAEDLQKDNREEKVVILPIGVKYYYLDEPWSEIEAILSKLEIDCGLVTQTSKPVINNENISVEEIKKLYARLINISEYLLSEIEKFYTRFYHQKLSPLELEENEEKDPNKILSLRLKRILNVVLNVAENYFYLKPKGEITDRCRRLEQAAWDDIYQQELKEDEQISAIKQGLANHIAEEAQLHIWHMRIVESFVAVTGYYVKEKLTAERFAETVLILCDLVSKIKGENATESQNLGQQKVSLTMGEPMSIKDYFQDYKTNRRQAVDKLTKDLQSALYEVVNK